MNWVKPNRVRSARDWMGRKIKPQINVESNVPLEIVYEKLSSHLSTI